MCMCLEIDIENRAYFWETWKRQNPFLAQIWMCQNLKVSEFINLWRCQNFRNDIMSNIRSNIIVNLILITSEWFNLIFLNVFIVLFYSSCIQLLPSTEKIVIQDTVKLISKSFFWGGVQHLFVKSSNFSGAFGFSSKRVSVFFRYFLVSQQA